MHHENPLKIDGACHFEKWKFYFMSLKMEMEISHFKQNNESFGEP